MKENKEMDNDKGYVIVTTALSLVLILGFGALAIDVVNQRATVDSRGNRALLRSGSLGASSR
jgi:hypothetical protein